MAEVNTIEKDAKAPPTLGKYNVYNTWKKTLKSESFYNLPWTNKCPHYIYETNWESQRGCIKYGN